MEKKIIVVYVEPNKKAVIKEIEDSLTSYKKEVSGSIEEYCPFPDNICIICNEEGKINGMLPNRMIASGENILDIIFGPFFIAGIDGDNLVSLTKEQQDYYLALFLFPEFFSKEGNKIFATKYDPGNI